MKNLSQNETERDALRAEVERLKTIENKARSLLAQLAEAQQECEKAKKERGQWAQANHRQIEVIRKERARAETAEQQLATQTAHVEKLREALAEAKDALSSYGVGVDDFDQTLAATATKGDAKPAKFQSLADQRDESQKIQRQAYKLLNGEPK